MTPPNRIRYHCGRCMGAARGDITEEEAHIRCPLEKTSDVSLNNGLMLEAVEVRRCTFPNVSRDPGDIEAELHEVTKVPKDAKVWIISLSDIVAIGIYDDDHFDDLYEIEMGTGKAGMSTFENTKRACDADVQYSGSPSELFHEYLEDRGQEIREAAEEGL